MTPDEFTNQEFFLDVGDGHQLYVQDWGKKDTGIPIIFLHGGPGDHVKDKHKGVFDPKRQRVIFFDQRGCGKSLPYGSLKNNTTKDLVADIDKLVKHLKFDQIIITGGSWGSCLALAYAIEHPESLRSLVLNGIFTGSKAEINWLDQGRFQTFFPDVWEGYLGNTPKAHHVNPSAYHFDRILGSNEQAAKESGYIYENLEGAVMALDDRFTPEDPSEYDPTGIKIEVYYMANSCFMPERHILSNASKLKMPIWLIQGRYDAVCPPTTAYELNQKLPNSNLVWTISGHRAEHESWNLIRTILLQLTGDH
ncbi:MAG TPA: alpha/beta fold hydrolase [Candidatus Saccharimonadales bacterium]|nr:alpha/beta fold hydrolase [Candidatus Saccharimonadales bacterium]